MLAFVAIFAIINHLANPLDNGLVRTPPMGWMSWTAFYCETDCEKHPDACINEKLYQTMGDRLVQDGFLEVGYNRIHIDDCWMEKSRNEKGRLVANRTRFPSGMKSLSKYMHDRGLQLGIYEDFGTETCEKYPGSLNHIKEDAETFASWDIDYLKLDGCNVNVSLMPTGYPKMERALNKTGRPIVYACGWPFFFYLAGKKDQVNFTAVREACNSWRIYDDVVGNWDSIESIIRFVDANQDVLADAQRPGGWNDPDMLVVGLPNVTADQARVQMTLWSMWSAPLIMSNDLRTLKPEAKKILTNRDVIAIDQDPLGIMGKLVAKRVDNVNIYVKPVTPVVDGKYSYAVATVYFTLDSLGLSNQNGYQFRDLWTGEDRGRIRTSETIRVKMRPTSALMLKLTID
ncbi:hypothetical protein Q1695_004545 [Nippostrongylus brasiliensis]|nr:hypothetical protein Q1695_004545 [Nippostrongylus brasiliensis]